MAAQSLPAGPTSVLDVDHGRGDTEISEMSGMLHIVFRLTHGSSKKN